MQSDTRDESTPPAGVSGAGSITAPVADAHVQERNDKAKTTPVSNRDWGPKGRVQSVVTLTAAKAVDVDGTLIGDVTDLMVDIITGRIAYVVVSVGAMLGLGGERYGLLVVAQSKMCSRQVLCNARDKDGLVAPP